MNKPERAVVVDDYVAAVAATGERLSNKELRGVLRGFAQDAVSYIEQYQKIVELIDGIVVDGSVVTVERWSEAESNRRSMMSMAQQLGDRMAEVVTNENQGKIRQANVEAMRICRNALSNVLNATAKSHGVLFDVVTDAMADPQMTGDSRNLTLAQQASEELSNFNYTISVTLSSLNSYTIPTR